MFLLLHDPKTLPSRGEPTLAVWVRAHQNGFRLQQETASCKHFMGLQTLLVSCSLRQMRAGKDHTDEGPKSGGEKEAVIYWGWRWGH